MFIGKNEIASVSDVTLNEIPYKVVSYQPQDGQEISPEYFSEEVFNDVQTKEPVDLTMLRDRRIGVVIKDVQKILLKHNVRLCDIQAVLQRVSNSIVNMEGEAVDKLWGADTETKTIQQMHNILLDK